MILEFSQTAITHSHNQKKVNSKLTTVQQITKGSDFIFLMSMIPWGKLYLKSKILIILHFRKWQMSQA